MENNKGLENYKKAKTAALLVIPIQIIARFCLGLQEENIFLCAFLMLVCVAFQIRQLSKAYKYTGGFWATMKSTFVLFISIGFGGAVDAALSHDEDRVIGRIGNYKIVERTHYYGSPLLAMFIPLIMCSLWFSCFFALPIVTVFISKEDIINNYTE